MINPNYSLTKHRDDKIITISNFLDLDVANDIFDGIKQISREKWERVIRPIGYSDETGFFNDTESLKNNEDFNNKLNFSSIAFHNKLFSHSFRRLNSHDDSCICIQCTLELMFKSDEINDEISKLIGTEIKEYTGLFTTKYEKNDYVGVHEDDYQGEYAFIYQLTKNWTPIYGGILNFWDKEKEEIYLSVYPKFNSLTIFKLKDIHHFVSINNSLHPRYAYTGWFKV